MPYNYMINVPDPTKTVTGGIMQGLQLASAVDKYKLQQQQRKQQEALQADLSALSQNPTPENIAQMMVKYPGMSEQFKRTYDVLDTEDQKERLGQAQKIYGAILSGRNDIAMSQLEEQAIAYENAGRAKDAKTLRDLAKTIEISPKTAETSMGLFLSGVMGPDKFSSTFTALQGERRATELHPYDVWGKTARARLDEAQANLARQQFDMEAKGVIPYAERPDAEAKFRKEYSDQTKGYKDVKAAYGRVLASQETAAGDLSLIFNYMKMLDPGSVVREGEFANAQNAGGVPDRIRNMFNNVQRGERLNTEQRKMFTKQAEMLYNQAQKQESTVRKGIERMATGYGLKPENIFYSPTEEAPQPPAEAPAAAPPPASGTSVTIGSKTFTFPNQQAADQFRKAAGI